MTTLHLVDAEHKLQDWTGVTLYGLTHVPPTPTPPIPMLLS